LKFICILKLFVLKNWEFGFFLKLKLSNFFLFVENLMKDLVIVVRRSPAAAVVLRKRF